MKILPDRTILLSRGEILPLPLVGKCELVPGEQFRYQLIFPQCRYHIKMTKILKCGKVLQDEYCSLKRIGVSPSICQNCKECSDGRELQNPEGSQQ